MIPPVKLQRHPKTGELIPEKWVPIIGYVGHYQISNYGRVKSLSRKDTNNHPINERLLRPDFPKGYARVTLCKETHKKRIAIHILVVRHFIKNPDGKPCVNHENGIKDDNFQFNLSWVTYSENTCHAFRSGLLTPPRAHLGRRGKLHHRSKSVLQSTLDGIPIKVWESGCLAAEAIGTHQSNISAVCRGKRNNTAGYKWSFH